MQHHITPLHNTTPNITTQHNTQQYDTTQNNTTRNKTNQVKIPIQTIQYQRCYTDADDKDAVTVTQTDRYLLVKPDFECDLILSLYKVQFLGDSWVIFKATLADSKQTFIERAFKSNWKITMRKKIGEGRRSKKTERKFIKLMIVGLKN